MSVVTNRYKITESYNSASKGRIFYVWKNDYLILSVHAAQREAKAAIKKCIVADKRTSGRPCAFTSAERRAHPWASGRERGRE
jgi:hypothetical protein